MHTSLPSRLSFLQYPCSSVGVEQLPVRDSRIPGDREQKGGLGLGGSPESGLSSSPSRFFPFKLSSIACKCKCPTISGRAQFFLNSLQERWYERYNLKSHIRTTEGVVVFQQMPKTKVLQYTLMREWGQLSQFLLQ